MRRWRRLFCILSALLLAGGGALAYAAGGVSGLPAAPIDRDDYGSLQRGAAVFMNYCSGCHSAQYMRYGRLAEDLGIPADQLRTHLMYTDSSLADGIQSAMSPDEAAEWFHQAAPPDLTLSAKLRGKDWLYGYLRGFYRDESRPSGWNNSVFPNVAMPHVLADLQGEPALGDNGETVLLRPGRLSATEYDLLVNDLVNFMDYMAEPSRKERYRAGYIILALLIPLLLLTFFLYKEYWRDVH